MNMPNEQMLKWLLQLNFVLIEAITFLHRLNTNELYG